MSRVISAASKARFLFFAAASLVFLAAGPVLAAPPQIDAGYTHSIVLKSDGSLWAWGENGYGQLGDNGSTDRVTPGEITAISGVDILAVGTDHNHAIKTDGTLWAWGRNSSGRLGDGTSSTRRLPVQIGSDTDWTAVAGGYAHSLAIKTDGTLWAWGENGNGQVGDGTTTDRYSPIPIGTDTDWSAVSAGDSHSLAIKTDGTLWAWGRNYYGQVGDGTKTDRTSPVQVGTDTDWAALSAGAVHSLALKSGGTLWAWGRNYYGQLGDGTTAERTSPVQVGSDTNWAEVSGATQYTLARKSDGTAWAWGNGNSGELGQGVELSSINPDPLQIGTESDWAAVAAGGGHGLALKGDGTLWGWGWYQGLGIGHPERQTFPDRVAAAADFTGLSVFSEWSSAMRYDGTIWSWGENMDGQFGTGDTVNRDRPVQAGAGSDWWQISAGWIHTLALREDGTLWGWGSDGFGCLGNGAGSGATSVPLQSGGDSDWQSVSAGNWVSHGIKDDGTLWGWGLNTVGQLGDDTTESRESPVQIGVATDWVSLAHGSDHTLGLRADGTIWSWGDNQSGQLGDGTTTRRISPVQVGSDTDWTAIAANYFGSLALKNDGTIWSWGDGSNTPVQIGSDTDWTAIRGGYNHSAALKSDGTLWTWGDNGYGQLGDGTLVDRSLPVQVGTDTDWVEVQGGRYHTVALKADGSLWSWGYNGDAALGIAVSSTQLAPIAVFDMTGKAVQPRWVAAGDGMHTDRIAVFWDDAFAVETYRIYRSATPGGPWAEIGTAGAAVRTYEDVAGSCGQTFYYAVSAGNVTGESTISPGDEGSTRVCAPTAPANVAASDGTVSLAVEVSWEDVADESLYRVYRSATSGGPWTEIGTAAADATTYSDPQPCPLPYYYTVKAFNDGGESPFATEDSGFALRVNSPPAAATAGPFDTDLGAGVTLDGSASSDPDEVCGDAIVSFEWDLDDDTTFGDSSGASVALTWSEVETLVCGGTCAPATPYPLALQVTDGSALTDTAASTLTIYDNQPTACFSADPNPADCGQTVDFDGGCSSHGRPDRSVATWEWDFDYDGGTFDVDGTGTSPTHVFTGAATYTVALRVTDDNAAPLSDIFTVDVSVLAVNDPPVAVPGGPYDTDSGSGLNLDASSSSDPNEICGDAIAAFEWDLDNDGTFGDRSGESVALSWADVESLVCGGACTLASPYTIGLRVTDGSAETGTATTTMTVYLNEPSACFSADPNPAGCAREVSFDAACSGHGRPDRTLVLYEWDFDYDGSTFLADDTGTPAATTYIATGTYNAALRVTDDNAGPRTDLEVVAITVNAVNDPPVPGPGGPYGTDLGTGISLDASGTTDPDVPCGDGITLYEWDLDNDGDFSDAAGIAPALTWPDVETLVCGGGCLPSTPYTVALRATDGGGLTAVAATTLILYDNNPVACITPDHNPAGVDQLITLDGSCATHGRPDRGIVLYEWDFDYDGSTFDVDNVGSAPQHAYTAAGTYTVALRVTDDNAPALTDLSTVDVTVISLQTPVIDAGKEHALAVRSDGTLWAWGWNGSGELGDGTTDDRDWPVQVGVDSDWTAVSAGYRYSLAVKSDGTLWAWGTNNAGQLGDGTTTDRLAPVQVGTDTDWVDASAGAVHSLGIKSNGTLWAWGVNSSGQLGDGSGTNSPVPVPVNADTDWTTFAAGASNSMAVKSGGTLWAWGDNSDGQLGDGTTTDRFAPRQIGSDTDWTFVNTTSTSYNSFGIRSDGTLWGWGDNWHGKLGDGTTTDRLSPVQIGPDTDWVSVSGGRDASHGVKSDGTLWGWGWGRNGALGDGTQEERFTPVQIGTDTDWMIVSDEYTQGFAMKKGWTLWAWGGLDYQGYFRPYDYGTPQQVGAASNWTAVAAGGAHGSALNASGELWSWGDNDVGTLGHGSDAWKRPVPGEVTPAGWTDFNSGGAHMLATRSDGTLWAWGGNDYGQIGDGTSLDRDAPVQIGTDTDWASVEPGGSFSMALKGDGSLWAWGYNTRGQIADGTSTHRQAPLQVGGDTDWNALSGGTGWPNGGHALALKSDGTLWAWGNNGRGQLGIGSADSNAHSSPQQVGADSDWSAISAGEEFSLALKSDGTLWSWGKNEDGQLGLLAWTPSSFSPVQVGAFNGWAAVAAWGSHSYALRADGTLWSWGYEDNGELGNAMAWATPHAPKWVTDLSLAPSPAPSWVTATDGTSLQFVDVAWEDVEGATEYWLYQAHYNPTGFRLERKFGPDKTTYLHDLLFCNIDTYYIVYAVGPGGPSAPSAIEGGNTWPCDPPPMPAWLDASDGTYRDKVVLSWENVPVEDGYNIYRALYSGSLGDQIGTVGPDVTTFEDPLPCDDWVYYYQVRPFNAEGLQGYPSTPPFDPGSTMDCADVVLTVGGAGGEFNSIQAALNASYPENTIEVEAGTYNGGIDFLGKDVAVRSLQGPEFTTIDAGGTGSAVVFSGGEGPGAVLDGFTLTGGAGTAADGSSGDDPGTYGGGVYGDLASPTVMNCIVSGNSALNRGGGMYFYGGTPHISSSVVSGNSSGEGGGLYFRFSHGELVNLLVSGNAAAADGGGLYLASSHAAVLNSTVAANSAAAGEGGGVINMSSSPVLVNSILWWNDAMGVPDQLAESVPGSTTVVYSNVEGGDPGNPGQPWPGAGNIDGDPSFVYPRAAAEAPTVSGNYTLTPLSPSIDTGTSDGATYPLIPSDDIDGHLRAQGAGYDMGADEHVFRGDWNADGMPDLFWQHSVSRANYLWYMNGPASTGGIAFPTVADTDWAVGILADFDDDGKPDILWRNTATGANYLWYMDGPAVTGADPVNAAGTVWDAAAAADFDLDGKPDILWRNTATGANYLWYMDGAVTTAVEALPSAGLDWSVRSADDFDGDGKPDILWRNTATGDAYLWYLDGAAVVGGDLLPPVSLNWTIDGTADFDGDGKPDICWRNYGNGKNYLWYMNGAVYLGGDGVPAVGDTDWHIEQ